jgi:hypothetical protein
MKKVSKFIYWTPRILSIVFILFLAMFSLDVFGNEYTFWQTILGLFMHNIPVFILTAVLIIAWKYEIVGGIAFILAGCLYIPLALIRTDFQLYVISWILSISGPAFLIGIMFLIGWKAKKV